MNFDGHVPLLISFATGFNSLTAYQRLPKSGISLMFRLESNLASPLPSVLKWLRREVAAQLQRSPSPFADLLRPTFDPREAAVLGLVDQDIEPEVQARVHAANGRWQVNVIDRFA